MSFSDKFKEALRLNKTNMENVKNFQYFDDLIHYGQKEISLNYDIILDNKDKSKYSEGIQIDIDNVTINGNGHYIDAHKKTRIFDIDGNGVTLKNLKFLNGKRNDFGGAIASYKKVKIIECSFKNNQAKQGSAISSIGDMFIYNCKFTDNYAKLGGAALANGGHMVVDSCIFKDNRSKKEGGAIFNGRRDRGDGMFSLSMMEINKSLFKNNKSARGGAICNYGILNSNMSTFSNNNAKSDGGAIWVIEKYGGKYNANDCEFENNKPNHINIRLTH